MKKIIFIISIILIWALTYIWKPLSLKNKPNIEKIKKSIVMIQPSKTLIEYEENPEWIFHKEVNGWIGAWFFVSKDGKIMTTKHVAPNRQELYTITDASWEKYEAKIIEISDKNEITLLQISPTNNSIEPLYITNNIKAWDTIISFWTDTNTNTILSRNGKITHEWVLKKNEDNKTKKFIEISSNLTPWFSWWPVINNKGEVVGINYGIKNGKNLIQPWESLQW